MLEKISNPIQDLQIKIKLQGVFAPPEQWYQFFYLGKLLMRLIQIFLHIASKYLIKSFILEKFNPKKY